MRVKSIFVAVCLLAVPGLVSADLYDPSIRHHPKDGVVKLYGAGGPHTAIQKVADLWAQNGGMKVEIIAGPESKWSASAQADADILWGTAEQVMTAFLETYRGFSSDAVEPVYIRPAVIAVKSGNPKGISGFEDLLKDGMRVVVTEGAGVYNTSGTGVWEDIAGRLGRLEDVTAFRKNIVAFSKGSGASYKAVNEMNADAWITWPNWPMGKDDLELVEIEDDRRIWRDLNMVLAADADPAARAFLDFLVSDEAQEIMAAEGWQR